MRAFVLVALLLVGPAIAHAADGRVDARAQRTTATDRQRVLTAARAARHDDPQATADLALHPERQFGVTGHAASIALAAYQDARALLHADARGDARFERAAVRTRLQAAGRAAGLPRWAGKRAITFVSNHNRKDGATLEEGTLVTSLGRPRDPRFQFSVGLKIREGKTDDSKRIDVRITDDEVHLQQDVRLEPGMRRDEVALQLLSATHGFLDGAFALVGRDGRERTIRVDVRFVDDPRVPVLRTPAWWGRSNSNTLYANATTRVAAHEATHRLFGAPDLYHDHARSPHRNPRARVLAGTPLVGIMDDHERGAPMPGDARAIAKLVEAVTGERVVVARARAAPTVELGAQPAWKNLPEGAILPLPAGKTFVIEPTPGALRVNVPRDKVLAIARDPAGKLWVKVRGYNQFIGIAGYAPTPDTWTAGRVPLALTAGPSN